MEQLGELLGYRAQIASYYGDSQAAYAYSQRALSYLNEQDLYERANVACALTLAALTEGEASSGVQHAFDASRLMQAADVTQAAICYHSIGAFLLHRQGQLHAAWRTYQEAIALGTGPENVPFTAVGLAYACQADLLREWNRLDEALDDALGGLHLAEQGGYMTVYLGRVYQALVRIYLSMGELDAAREALQELLQLPLLARNPYQQAILTSVEQVRLWINSGEEEQALRWAREQKRREYPLPPLAAERVEMALARVCLLQGQAREALTCLEQVIAQATAQQRQEQVLEARIVQALAWQAMQQEERALATLAEAVRLAEPEGYQRIFVDEGARLQTLLASLCSGESQQIRILSCRPARRLRLLCPC
jgi:LuxR family maltose regulon positive regulatory protein